MRRWKFIGFIAMLLAHPASSQFVENFSDGELAGNPAWQGDASVFNASTGRLRLQAPPAAGTATLATPSEAIHEGNWEFFIQLDFTPSSTNYAKVYLTANQPSLQNGYFVKIGGSTREVSLYVKSGTGELELIDGTDDRVNQPIVNLQVRVTRASNGSWSLYSDVGRTGSFVAEGTATDLTHLASAWFGVQCIYTSTRSDKFWFDDFVVSGSVVPDTSPPVIVSATATHDNRIQIIASEPLMRSSVVPSGIRIDGIGTAVTAELQSDPSIVEAALPLSLLNGVTYTLHVENFSDVSGNLMIPTTNSVRYFLPASPAWKSVLISEILADPSPQVGLPSAEFIEIHNPGALPFDLTGWRLTDGSSTGTFPSAALLPGEFIVVTSTASAALFNGGAIGLTNFPSLNNSGDHLRLTAPDEVFVDSVAYDIGWYNDEDKQEGGWSLELIDPRNPCGEENNWTASDDVLGGTPGQTNSVLAEKPDLTPPILERVYAIDSVTLSIVANEALNVNSQVDVRIVLNPKVEVKAASFSDPSRRNLLILLGDALRTRTAYEVLIDGLRDCNGNLMLPVAWVISLTEDADSLDLRLSEVLFNPRSGGADFVEIFNASEKFIDLSAMTLSNGMESTPIRSWVMVPGSQISISEDPNAVDSQYPLSTSGAKLKSALPSFPDDAGEFLLVGPEGRIIDHLAYDHSWHSPLLQDEEGVSLERIDLNGPTPEQANWQSASGVSGYATPGLPNSQRRDNQNVPEQVRVEPEIFSPGDDTFDFVQILYRFDQPGRVGTVRILNSQGAFVRDIANNELLGTEGSFRWDGERDDGRKASLGYYVVWMETFDPAGGVATFRKRVVVARR
jgi:hypothetical protein